MKKSTLTFTTVREMHLAGELEAAKSGYLAILRSNPNDIETLHSLGILYAQQENYTDAHDYLQRATELEPTHPVINLHFANILKFQGLFTQASQILEKTLQNNPNYLAALNNLGTVYYAQGKLDNAVQCYRNAIQQKSDYIDAYYNLGLALIKKDLATEAIAVYKKLLSLEPAHFAARFHLACALMQENQIAEAVTIFLQIETTHSHHFETQTNLATCYLKLGSLIEAKAHYFKALEINPTDKQILFNLGVISTQLNQVDTAIQYYQRILQINPDEFAAHNNLGAAFLAKQHTPFALQHFQEALRVQPNNMAVRHTIEVLSQHQRLLTSPPDYIQALFDSYADHYDAHLLTALDYHIPDLILKALMAVKKPAEKAWDILDLGCGTGLCGTALKPFAKSLVGVDLSSKMLAMAAQKNIYDELITADLTGFLTKKNSAFDVILAGDVLVYLGELNSIFKAANTALRPQGLLLFNTEIGIEAEFKMNQSGRFLHNKIYVEKMAAENNFKIIYYQTVNTRQQNNEPVPGHLFVLEKRAASCT